MTVRSENRTFLGTAFPPSASTEPTSCGAECSVPRMHKGIRDERLKAEGCYGLMALRTWDFLNS